MASTRTILKRKLSEIVSRRSPGSPRNTSQFISSHLPHTQATEIEHQCRVQRSRATQRLLLSARPTNLLLFRMRRIRQTRAQLCKKCNIHTPHLVRVYRSQLDSKTCSECRNAPRSCALVQPPSTASSSRCFYSYYASLCLCSPIRVRNARFCNTLQFQSPGSASNAALGQRSSGVPSRRVKRSF